VRAGREIIAVRTGGRDYYGKINARINIPLVP
jgi:hypothetical protein